MIKNALLIALLLLCLVLVWRIRLHRRRENELLGFTRRKLNREDIKYFANTADALTETGLVINQLCEGYEQELLEARQSDKANRELMTSLSHDIRTPLTSLLGYLDAVENDMVIGEERDQYIRTAHKKANDLKTYVDMLFTWLKIGSHEMRYDLQLIDINELTREVLISCLALLSQNNFKLKSDITETELFIQLDASAYQRILMNLIQNAIDHSHADTLMVKVCSNNEQVLVSVSDNGIGIAEDKLPFIFTRLYKVETSRSGHGSGLGLAIVKALTEAQHGSVSVTSQPGVLTTFNLTFPLA